MSSADPYDEVPYRSMPIEWTAPERLAVASMLGGGPRAAAGAWRVLELGCGDGSNLIPMARHRPGAAFVGVDGATLPIERARARGGALGLTNLTFVASPFETADRWLDGSFDFVIAHGVISWVGERTRDALLALCARRLKTGGLLYLNFNARPGWAVRGAVREFLLAGTATAGSLRERAETALAIASRMAGDLVHASHPYQQWLANEFRFVGEHDATYIAHEYLARDNHAFWFDELEAMCANEDLHFVADAARPWFPEPGRGTAGVDAPRDVVPPSREHDLLVCRQMHFPIFSKGAFERRPPLLDEIAALEMASCMQPDGSTLDGSTEFVHPSGFRVEARLAPMAEALGRLARLWPAGLPIRVLFGTVAPYVDDLLELRNCGLVDLRIPGPAGSVELRETGLDYGTSVHHAIVPLDVSRADHVGG